MVSWVLCFLSLFVYIDFLAVLEGYSYLVIVDVNPVDKLTDIRFIIGLKRTGKAVKDFAHFFDFLHTLLLECSFCEKFVALFPKGNNLKTELVSFIRIRFMVFCRMRERFPPK